MAAWIVWALLSFYGASESHAQDESGQTGPWEITADRITYNQFTETYTAEGNVRLTREGRVLTADEVRFDKKNGQASAEGNVHLLSGQDSLTGRRLDLNLNTETGALSEGKLFLSQNHMYVSGKLILKTGPQTYFVQDASVTTCDPPEPAWRITGKDLKVTIEGYGFVKHAALWAKELPVMYTPYLIFPVKIKRQSGLLTPEFSFSDRKGVEYLQPFFWAIGDSTDATFFADYMSERGMRLGAEYRYVAGERAWGTLMADGLDDRRIDDGLADHSQRWGYTDDPFLRTNSGRYWLRGKINQNLPWGMTAKVDLDVVSDQDYLREFKNGLNGFDETETVFLRSFSRDVDDFTDPLRENQLNINRLWTDYAFNANARWYHDAVRSRPPGALSPLQNLPEITMDGIKQKISGSPFYYDLASSYTYFYREEGDRGHRADVYPRIYYPTRLFNALSVEPSAGIRQTVWRMDPYETAPADDRTNRYRAIYDLKLDTSTDLYRIYRFDTAGSDRLKHNLRPQIIYQYIPDEYQGDYPEFDALDRIDPQNLITFALTNTLIARKPPPPDSQTTRAVYIPFLRFRLEESFDINKYNDGDPRPFSDLFGELDLRPGRYVQLDGDFLWRPYDGEFYGYNVALHLWDLRGDRFSLDYRFTRGTTELQAVRSVNASAAWQVTQYWQLRGRYERDLQGKQFLESGVGVSYIRQCWGADFDYKRDEEDNSSISAVVHLTGLGSLGR